MRFRSSGCRSHSSRLKGLPVTGQKPPMTSKACAKPTRSKMWPRGVRTGSIISWPSKEQRNSIGACSTSSCKTVPLPLEGAATNATGAAGAAASRGAGCEAIGGGALASGTSISLPHCAKPSSLAGPVQPPHLAATARLVSSESCSSVVTNAPPSPGVIPQFTAKKMSPTSATGSVAALQPGPRAFENMAWRQGVGGGTK
mmetsp:Transcript_14919/g.41003  ORF Transcript_14919/g.41003 Transcript_14919/m.41003 type:complete len:200 (+) Transcript_14919:146-745(+)